jgi:hypothetical protein
MNREWPETGDTDELGRDIEIAHALSLLDPASQDPNYWFRFRTWVMTGAARELARRRMVARVTVGDVVHSWARTLVPTALLAAMVAGLLLWRNEIPAPMSLEELLVSDLGGETIPVMASPARTRDAAIFAMEAF